jgi:hypothetical protein
VRVVKGLIDSKAERLISIFFLLNLNPFKVKQIKKTNTKYFICFYFYFYFLSKKK